MADYYSDNADALFERYNALDFDAVHADLVHCMPGTTGSALDVGAGAGRDALALARRGWEVVAVEPAKQLRERGQSYTQGYPVQWMDDSLPALTKVRALSERFNLILLSAVWMHVPPRRCLYEYMNYLQSSPRFPPHPQRGLPGPVFTDADAVNFPAAAAAAAEVHEACLAVDYSL